MSCNSREIITFQLGHFSNFIGSHWWNLQESTFVYSASDQKYPKEVNNDVTFREGKNLSGEITYTPRLIAVDLKGSLNTLKQDGVLYDVKGIEEELPWKSDVTLHKLDIAVQKNAYLKDLEKDTHDPDADVDEDKHSKESNEADKDTSKDEGAKTSERAMFGPKFYDLDGSVKVWSDFLKLHLHPKSLHIVDQYRHDEEQFDLYAFGEQLYKERQSKTELEDRAHFFLEECDSMQGMQFFVDMYDGFGGLASALLEELSEDYSNKSVLIYSATPTQFQGNSIASECQRVVNTALALDKLVTHSSAVVPLSLASSLWRKPGPARSMPHLRYKPELNYHSSAILAAAIDSVSLPWRQETCPVLLPHLLGSMATQGRKLLALNASLPLARNRGDYLVDYLWKHQECPPWQSLTPYCSASSKPWSQSVVLQGVHPDTLKGPPDPKFPAALNNCRRVDDVMNLYLNDVCGTPLNVVHHTQRPCPVGSPFPHIFADNIGVDGWLSPKLRPPYTGVAEVPMLTSLQATQDMSNYLSALVDELSRYNIKKFHKFTDNGLEEDSFKECVENLRTLRKSYLTNESKSSDSDSD